MEKNNKSKRGKTSAAPCCASCDCDCGKPAGGKTVKWAIFWVVLLAVGGIIVYKTILPDLNGGNVYPVQNAGGGGCAAGGGSCDVSTCGCHH